MILKIEYAPVMELVDMRDLGSRAAMRVGSSPFRRTKSPQDCNFLRAFSFKEYFVTLFVRGKFKLSFPSIYFFFY